MKASDIMTTNIVSINSLMTIAEAAKFMKQHNVRALIVDRTSDQDAYGIITATDISQAVANAKNPQETYVYEVMTKPCIVVNPDLAVEHIANLFTRAKIHTAPVIKDKLLGIISMTDILTKTNGLIENTTQLTPQKIEESVESAEISLDRSRENEWGLDYDNWCSG
ncbi:MAG: CBS domain-containing protein [Xenococcaceae cyanobacterium MO_188.B29]|nr:CBS domain-containing protein [Xenococcaceae cyanobacterium MO_188.B29]